MISQITIDGNLGRDPELRTFQSGDKIITASIGHAQGYMDRQQNRWVSQGTLWVDLQARATDPILSRAHKGDHIVVAGILTQSTYKGKDGQDHTTLHIRVQQSGLIPRMQQGGQGPTQSQAQQSQPKPPQNQADAWASYGDPGAAF